MISLEVIRDVVTSALFARFVDVINALIDALFFGGVIS